MDRWRAGRDAARRGAAACAWWRGCSDARRCARRRVPGPCRRRRADVRAERWAWWCAGGGGGCTGGARWRRRVECGASRGGRVARDGGAGGGASGLRGAAGERDGGAGGGVRRGRGAPAAADARGARSGGASSARGRATRGGPRRKRLAPLVTRSPERAPRVLAPKAYGAWHVHGATACAALEWAVHFSSVAACFGNVGRGVVRDGERVPRLARFGSSRRTAQRVRAHAAAGCRRGDGRRCVR